MKALDILICSALVMSGPVAAKDQIRAGQRANADQYYGLYRNPSQAIVPTGDDSVDFGRSGIRRRADLGADVFHPEGPGNVSD
jgi:hypothetical protein